MPRLILSATVASVIAAIVPASLIAQSGISDDRVSVPDGPGSVEGVGDNASINPNMGMMSYAVPFELPAGFAGATPSLGLAYGSGTGNTVVGVGWAMQVPSIERLTLRGLPSYDADDELVANGGEQLVRVSTSGGAAVYRERFESSFVRYTWHGAGSNGYFTAEYPDGSIGTFGATSDGTLVPEACLRGPDGEVFRYHLVERVDVFGHRVRYAYAQLDGSPYLTGISYVYGAGGAPRYTVTLAYTTRPDTITDCKPGFEERTTRRLVEVSIATSSEVIRRYVLGYEPAATSGGLSRLAKVERFGRDGSRYPVVFTFGYSRALGGVCTLGACDAPFVVDMGSVPAGGGIASGDTTLVDINGDALPDLVDAHAVGAHVFMLNRLEGEGRSSFDPATYRSTVATRSAFPLSQPNVEPLDVNGDGLADLVNTVTGNVLCNDGSGDWRTTGCVPEGGLGFMPDGTQAGLRFLDIDGDRRIDVVRTTSASLIDVWRNTGETFEALASAEPIGAAFDVDQLVLADVNGDSLLDAVEIGPSGIVRYRASLGRGRWLPWRDLPAPALSASERVDVALEDLNGDGLDDLVLVGTSSVRYALNRAAASFDAFATLDATSVPGLPTRGPGTTILYADMNANGTQDVVWVQANGDVRYLELFPVLPNLLSRIENGLGMVQAITYGTAAGQRAADATSWTRTLPIAANVVTRLDTWTTLTGGEDGAGLHEITAYRYRDGFYDGVEKQLRGFAEVETTTPDDGARDDQEAGRVVSIFDVGATDAYRSGLLLSEATYSGAVGAERALLETRTTYADCDVAELPDVAALRFPVRYVCETERTSIVKEGAAETEWAATRVTTTYDGYGQVIRSASLGVVHMGPPESPTSCAPCTRAEGSFGAPCGATCTGDEAFVDTTYVTPGTSMGGRWMLGRAHTTRRYAVEGGLTSEVRTYYDGPEFVGMPLGQLTTGNVSRSTALRDAGGSETVALSRSAYDAHGNVTIALDPLGSPVDDTAHRRSYTYDATGLRLVRTDVHVASAEGAPYRLRREYSYDAAFDGVSEATGWMIVEGGVNRSARKQTSARYDAHGRRVAIIRPGDTEATPTIEYQWDLGEPASRIVERTRSVRGGAADLERVICVDGRGRTYQERTRIDGQRYQISGFAEHNSRGAILRMYQPYVREGGGCDTEPPTNVLYDTIRYDALAREIRRTYPDADAHGASSSTETRYAPLATATFDENDLDPTSPHAGTPTLVHHDGLGRTVAVERRLTANTTGAFTRAAYDGLGHLSALADAEGNTKHQAYDLLGRLRLIDDPSSGETSLTYDDAGNLLTRTDARGVVTRMTYDGANRALAQWDEADPMRTEVRVRYDAGGSCAASSCTNAEGQAIEISYPMDEAVVARLGGLTRGVDHFGFDARAQGTYRARTIAGLPLVTRHTFDNAGRLASTMHPDGRMIDRAYDGASRPIGLDGVVEDIAYDDRGLTSRIDRTNGAFDALEHDARGQLEHRTIATSLGTALEDVAFERDRAGNITGLADAAAAPTSWRALDVRFTYDAWYRVLGAEYLGEGDAAETQTRTYDAIDNARSVTSSRGASSPAHLGELAYDEARPNAVVSAGGTTYRYDGAGYMVAKGDLDLAWDHLGRLVRATRDDVEVARFAYGAGTSRVARVEGDAVTLYASGDYELRDGIGVLYARLGRQRVARLESDALAAELLGDPAPRGRGDGEVNAADAWIASTEQVVAAAPGTLLRSAARRLLAEEGDGNVALHTDHLGSLVAATDANGDERGHRRFVAPAGEDRQSGYVDAYGFSGQEMVDSVGLVRFEHRWLDTRTMRWTSPDPAFEGAPSLGSARAGELADRYAYVGNDFVNNADPLGLTKTAARTGAPQQSKRARTAAKSEEESEDEATDAGQGGNGDAAPGPDRTVTVSGSLYPQSAQHIRDAQAAGHPATLTIDRGGAAANRRQSLRGIKTQPTKDRDEYPPAMFREGGAGASVRHIDSSDNRGAGSSIGQQCRGLPDGATVKLEVED